MKKILTLIGFIALMQGQFAWASATTVGESSTTPCTAINSSTVAAEPVTPATTTPTPPAPVIKR